MIVTSSSDEKIERAKKLGADDAINYREKPDWEQEARRLTGGRGVDHIVEVGGADTFPRSIMAARVGGHVAVIGILSGLTKDVNVAAIFAQNEIQSVTVARMEVPCCAGIVRLVLEVMKAAGVDIPLREVKIGIRGERR